MRENVEMHPAVGHLDEMVGAHSKRLAETVRGTTRQPFTDKVHRIAQQGKRCRGVFQKVPGSGEWWIRYADATGRIRREKAGSKSNAIKLRDKRKAQALEGKKLPENLRHATVTFGEIAGDCLAWCDEHRRRSSRKFHRKLMPKLVAWFGGKGVDSLAPQEIEAKFKTEDWTPATWNRYRAVLSLAYRLAIRNGKASSNPARSVQHKTEHNERTRFLAPEEERRLRGAIRELAPMREAEFDLALHTGLRLSEQYGARWDDVDFEGRSLRIPEDKSGKTSYVRLNDSAISALLGLRERTLETGMVCGGTGRPYHWFWPVLRKAGVSNFRWHDLRHTFASRAVMSGADVRTVAELLRDRTLQMVMRYAHLAPDYKLEAVRRMERQFQAPTDTTTDTGENKGFARVN